MVANIVVVFGIPGVGKTTVLSETVETAPKKGLKVQVVNFGDKMLEVALEEKLIEGGEKARDQIRRLSLETQRRIQRIAGEKIAKIAEESEGTVIVDTHVLIQTPFGYLTGLPVWVAEALKPNILAIIEAKIEEIASRRAKDLTRERDLDEEEKIKEHQEMNRWGAVCVATLTGATVAIIENSEKKVGEASKTLIKLIKSH